MAKLFRVTVVVDLLVAAENAETAEAWTEDHIAHVVEHDDLDGASFRAREVTDLSESQGADNPWLADIEDPLWRTCAQWLEAAKAG